MLPRDFPHFNTVFHYFNKWKLKGGEPVFSDERLAQMFKYCIEGISTDAATSRWRKDQM